MGGFYAFDSRIRSEGWPDDPPTGLRRTRLDLLATSPSTKTRRWAVWRPDGSEIVASAGTSVTKTGTNEHIAIFHISVLPERRREGIARELLELVVRGPHREDRTLQLFRDPFTPEMVGQGDTGVSTEHRNQGLGRWLKAAMLKRVLRQRPEAKAIRTSNAASNEPMLRINRELGFKPVKSFTTWQLDIDRAREYLAG